MEEQMIEDDDIEIEIEDDEEIEGDPELEVMEE